MPRQYHKNPRQITTKQMTMLAHDLAELGDLSGIVHDLNSDEIIGGNQRSKIFDLAKLNIVLTEELPEPDEQGTVGLGYVLWQGKKYAYRAVRWDAKTAEKANIVANKAGGTFDFDILANQFEIDDLLEWGFEPFELGIEEEEPEPAADPGAQVDRAEELREAWDVQPGQMWQLGEHRLICGDCTDAAVVERVMGGERAGAVVTDSPYGINREGIENDDPEGLRQLFDGCLSAMPVDDAVIINFQSPRLFPIWLDALRAAGHKFARALWMYDENDQTKPWHYWLMCSQIIFVSTVGNPKWEETKAHHDTYVIGLSREWRAGGEGNDYAHASVKPVGVVADLLSHTTGIAYEPFSGSGTTLIACEQLSRKCRAVEISPAYVAVALQRWADMTGQTPELLTD